MPRSVSSLRLLAAGFAAITMLGAAAWAQQAPPTRIRGTIEAVDGPMLSIKSRDGSDMKVKMTDNVAVFAVVKTQLSEIKEGSYIGVTAMPEPDGTQKAIAVHIFPENQRGAAEGFRPWDLRPNSTMTNATVAETVLDGLREERFAILPHPQVLDYMRKKTENYDRWIRGMNNFRRRLAS